MELSSWGRGGEGGTDVVPFCSFYPNDSPVWAGSTTSTSLIVFHKISASSSRNRRQKIRYEMFCFFTTDDVDKRNASETNGTFQNCLPHYIIFALFIHQVFHHVQYWRDTTIRYYFPQDFPVDTVKDLLEAHKVHSHACSPFKCLLRDE